MSADGIARGGKSMISSRRMIALVLAGVVALSVGALIIHQGQSGGGGIAGNSTVSTVSANGVELSLADNVSSLYVGQSLNVDFSILNALPSVNTVEPANDPAFLGVPVALWPVCYTPIPAYAVVLIGDYTLQELQNVANVTMPIVCTAGGGEVTRVTFQPNSSEANITQGYVVTGASPELGSFSLSTSFTTNGYWNLIANSKQDNPPILGSAGQYFNRQPTATAFVPGAYTVAIADEWGQTALLHFVVLNDGTKTAEKTTIGSSSNGSTEGSLQMTSSTSYYAPGTSTTAYPNP